MASVTTHRVSRGRESQVWLAELVAKELGFDAQSRPASLPGTDIILPPDSGLAFEMKATEANDVLGGLRQAASNAAEGALPIYVYRPRGYGLTKIELWPMVVRLRDGLALLRKAGYHS